MEIISRGKWGAEVPRNSATIPTPTPELWLHHTAGNHSGIEGVRAVQKFHKYSRGWWDIAYSFIIDRDTCEVYEGRGFGQLGGHTFGHNAVSHAICVMGNFNNDHPSQKLLNTIAELVRYGYDQGKWPQVITGGHRDVRATDCPGDNLYDKIDEINERAIKQVSIPKPQLDKVDRLAERVWILEVISVIDRTFLEIFNRVPLHNEILHWLELAKEEGVEFMVQEIKNG